MQFAKLEAASRITLEDGRVLTRCDQCLAMHSERTPPTEPPCDGCRVELLEENREAAAIFYLIQSQFIMGEGGPVDINHLAIYAAMDLYHVKDRVECFHKVLSLTRWHIEEIAKRANSNE